MRSTVLDAHGSTTDHVVAVDLHRRTPAPAASRAASAARRWRARTSSRASGTRSRSSSAHTSPSRKRVVGVRARVADRVEVVADAHDRDAVAVDVEAARRPGREIVAARHDGVTIASPISASPARCSSLSTTERRRPRGERADREALEHVVEEAEHDQPLGLLGRDAAALEVVELVVVDRPDGGGVRALHVVGLDLEVRDRLRARALAEHEVAVRLGRVRPSAPSARRCTSPEYTERAVSSTAPLNSRSLRVRGASWSWSVRKSSICVAVAEVDGELVALAALRRAAAPRCAAGRSRRRARPPRCAASRRGRRARAAGRGATCAGRAPAPRGSAGARCRRRAAR